VSSTSAVPLSGVIAREWRAKRPATPFAENHSLAITVTTISTLALAKSAAAVVPGAHIKNAAHAIVHATAIVAKTAPLSARDLAICGNRPQSGASRLAIANLNG
jgi:hypothetical protein